MDFMKQNSIKLAIYVHTYVVTNKNLAVLMANKRATKKTSLAMSMRGITCMWNSPMQKPL